MRMGCSSITSANSASTERQITMTAMPQFVLTVTRAGSGAGSVTSQPIGITCGNDCTEAYTQGTVVHLTANPASQASAFTGWSGACSGGGECVVTMSTAGSVTATFVLTATAVPGTPLPWLLALMALLAGGIAWTYARSRRTSADR